MTHKLLFYEYVENIVERRAPHRAVHLELAKRWHEDGRLLYGGATGDPPDGGLLIFTADADVEAFTREDPYVQQGLVTSFRVVPWNEVVS